MGKVLLPLKRSIYVSQYEPNWEERRYEIAKEMLPAVKDIKRYDDNGNLRKLNRNEAAYEAVKYADALIAELKKTTK